MTSLNLHVIMNSLTECFSDGNVDENSHNWDCNESVTQLFDRFKRRLCGVSLINVESWKLRCWNSGDYIRWKITPLVSFLVFFSRIVSQSLTVLWKVEGEPNDCDAIKCVGLVFFFFHFGNRIKDTWRGERGEFNTGGITR